MTSHRVPARRRPAIAALALGLVVGACGGGAPDASDGGGSTTAAPTSTTASPGEEVETSEMTLAGLRTLVVRPEAAGTYPLVVFVHGAGAPPEFYADLLEPVAAAGHVVIAPAMPGSVDHSDFTAVASLPFQPGRMEQVLGAALDGDRALEGVDRTEVAAMGHSLGAMASLATAFNSCCLDRRIDAVVAFAGQLPEFPGGSWRLGSVPALLVHGEADDVVPYSGSAAAVDTVGVTTFLFTVEGGDHGSYLGADDPAFPAVRDGVLAFLDATIGGAPRAGLADLTTAADGDDVRLTHRP